MEITARKPLLDALRSLEADYVAILPIDQIKAVLTRGGASNPIPRQNAGRVKSEVGRLIQRVFYVGDNDVFGAGNIGLSPYANLLNKLVGQVTWEVIQAHHRFLAKQAPDIYPELRRRSVAVAPVGLVAEIGDDERRRFYERWAHLRIFSPNPLAQYDPAHTWVDPNGYQLSDRIWRTGNMTRQRLDALITDGINQGWSAERIAREAERFLRPDRADIRTNRPYGRDASYDAMRLARSEIARAHGHAALAAARLNPYVNEWIFQISGSHGKTDICDDMAAGSPYDINGFCPVQVQDTHPQCLCYAFGRVSGNRAQITEDIRQSLIEAQQLGIQPYVNPSNPLAMLSALLGPALAAWVLRELGEFFYGGAIDGI